MAIVKWPKVDPPRSEQGIIDLRKISSAELVASRPSVRVSRSLQSWSLTSLQQGLFKTSGRLIRHARYFILQLAESHLTGSLFRQIVGRIERLAWQPT